MIDTLIVCFYVIGGALLVLAPVQQVRIILAHANPDAELDTKWAFLAHGIASFGALVFHVLKMELPCSVCFLVIGLVSAWTYWIRPLYKH